MLVGFMADIPFVVSSRYIRTFDDYSRSSGGRWAQHDIIGDKPVLEYLGPDVEKISLPTVWRRYSAALTQEEEVL